MGDHSNRGHNTSDEVIRPDLHIPVLLDKVNIFMDPVPGKNFIDSTGGPGSMSRALLEKTAPDGRVLTIDCDPGAIEQQEKMLGEFGTRSIRCRANFSGIHKIARDNNFIPVDGVVYDLGVSSPMFDDAGYGMSFRVDAKLDMRFDPDIETTAHDLVNNLPEGKLAELFRGMDERRFARRIASAIVRERERNPIETTRQLADLIAKAIPRKFHPRSMHVATKYFLSLRVEVNMERESLEMSLGDIPDVLDIGGVLVVICYSSFEDRILRAAIREKADRWKRLTKKAVFPDADEIERNPRSRSARLRAYRKVA